MNKDEMAATLAQKVSVAQQHRYDPLHWGLLNDHNQKLSASANRAKRREERRMVLDYLSPTQIGWDVGDRTLTLEQQDDGIYLLSAQNPGHRYKRDDDFPSLAEVMRWLKSTAGEQVSLDMDYLELLEHPLVRRFLEHG